MTTAAPPARLVDNIIRFARILRRAGLPVGPGRVIDAAKAVAAVGVERRDDFYWALHTVCVRRAAERVIFNQAFHAFWRNPLLLERMMALPMPAIGEEATPESTAGLRRLYDAMPELAVKSRPEQPPEPEPESGESYSAREVFQKRDFDKMTAAEIAAAKQAIGQLRLPVEDVPTRRFQRHALGRRVDMRATLRASLRSGGEVIPLRHKRRRRAPPPLVVLCDISGSMGRYSRMLLHFTHALTSDRERVHSFVFGTRLTNITRQLRHRDVDEALDRVVNTVEDWSGGTRIATSLQSFNLTWSRRVLGQGAIVLLITDGLERDDGIRLGREMERLHLSCRRLIWLNPLLRYEGFEPKSLGVRAMMPHVDEFRPVHNLDSLGELAQALERHR